MLLCLSGCGPASSDHMANVESHAKGDGPSEQPTESQNASSTHRSQVAMVAHLVPLASTEPTRPAETLVLPDWIAQALDSPEVSVRLQALDIWAQQGANAPLDPLVVALDDEDDDVRTMAMAIIEQHWEAVAQEAVP